MGIVSSLPTRSLLGAVATALINAVVCIVNVVLIAGEGATGLTWWWTVLVAGLALWFGYAAVVLALRPDLQAGLVMPNDGPARRAQLWLRWMFAACLVGVFTLPRGIKHHVPSSTVVGTAAALAAAVFLTLLIRDLRRARRQATDLSLPG